MNEQLKQLIDEETYWPNDWDSQLEHLYAECGELIEDGLELPLAIDADGIARSAGRRAPALLFD